MAKGTYGTAQIGKRQLMMPHPHYSSKLESDFYHSCVKAIEVVDLLKRNIAHFPRQIDGHALCQHYGLPTHYLDFSEDVWTSGFFASHYYPNLKPVTNGIGVLYVLDRKRLPDGVCHEIGIQPLARPFAQRGWLLKTHPGLDVAVLPSIRQFFFEHSKTAGKKAGERFNGGSKLLPGEKLAEEVASCIKTNCVRQVDLDAYLDGIRRRGGDHETTRSSIEKLFKAKGLSITKK